MSRALILIAQARFLKRPLTAEETAECLAAWATVAPGQRIYIPEPERQGELFNKARDYKAMNWSIRRIAKELRCSKSQVHKLLSTNSRLPSGQDPA